MYPSSTQRKHWTFSTSDPELMKKIRLETYKEYVDHFAPLFEKSADDTSFFLSFEEDQRLISAYERQMNSFCKTFRPPLPPNVVSTAFHYYKRFYLSNTAMNYHPKDMYSTCVFLACKIEEFTVSIDEFTANFDDKHRARMSQLILNLEFVLICSIKFHLTIHTPHRAVKGILLDMEMKRPGLLTMSLEEIMPLINEFLEKVHFTDLIFHYPPSQIALASVFQAIGKKGVAIDEYVSSCLIPVDKLLVVSEAVKSIRHTVKRLKFSVTAEEVAVIETKLEECRNQENNIDSPTYRKPMDEESLDDDDIFG